MSNTVLGIDIGASGMKGNLVDMKTGALVAERLRLPTPESKKPKDMAKTFAAIVQHFNYKGVVGCGFPAIVKDGVAFSASNVDDSWIGTNVEKVFGKACGLPVYVTNDADAAGIAEMAYGAGKKKKGLVLLITIGSGLGSAMFYDEELVPNMEFGHFYLKDQKKVAEKYAADSVRKAKGLSWPEWGKRFNEYLTVLERITSPNLIILGGGSSKRFDLYKDKIKIDTEVIPAQLLNGAGIVGAATYAHVKCGKP